MRVERPSAPGPPGAGPPGRSSARAGPSPAPVRRHPFFRTLPDLVHRGGCAGLPGLLKPPGSLRHLLPGLRTVRTPRNLRAGLRKLFRFFCRQLGRLLEVLAPQSRGQRAHSLDPLESVCHVARRGVERVPGCRIAQGFKPVFHRAQGEQHSALVHLPKLPAQRLEFREKLFKFDVGRKFGGLLPVLEHLFNRRGLFLKPGCLSRRGRFYQSQANPHQCCQHDCRSGQRRRNFGHQRGHAVLQSTFRRRAVASPYWRPSQPGPPFALSSEVVNA